ncbi:E3 ubiquitin-protein ligase ORTHRUS 2-like [Phoenix dactylifera]|uniref:RING-type E3 ubiquitin transferase n=1 Tax=Phoenix dactylifera TaxID=42345 RepID=A0A8B7D566_PHODC|nr:E3 ubiquitin-protein ligase ORTHRUS 2-like [Phoenix dactylifera]
MAPSCDLPCDGDGVCMVCKAAPPEAEVVVCRTCATPWHASCLSRPPETLAAVADWECPDCSPSAAASTCPPVSAALSGASGDLIASIRAIEADTSLTEKEKARRRQALVSGGVALAVDEEKGRKRKGESEDHVLDLFDEKFKCAFCMQLPERPVTTPCGHNFCLKCFQKWVGQGKRKCAKCRDHIPASMASQPRINSALVVAIRMAKTTKSASMGNAAHVYHFVRNEHRPEKAFTTERAKRAGKANACSGQIFVTVPPDHFGPILVEHDPKRSKGVLVGELWEDRMECRQWGAHLPHVAGIAGQSEHGAQSVALSGGYEDDEDHGDWFLYTGSGGRDLSGNKRTNKDQSFDQKFEKLNKALRVSCLNGYPVRVVRSHKEKRSSYAPENGVRYDGIYRVEKCWRKVGVQGFKVCRYLFVRCDNEPAPWTSDEHGDRPRPLPVIQELKHATDITARKQSPAWDYDEEHGWRWTKPPPQSKKCATSGKLEKKRGSKAKKHGQSISMREKLLKEFCCLICGKVMILPLTTPCAHNFCKRCLLGSYPDQSFVRERTCRGRTLRAQKIVKKCPCCSNDISNFLQNPQVNRELMDLIESLQQKTADENVESSEEGSAVVEKSEEGNNYGNKKLSNYGRDSVDDKVREEQIDGLEGKRPTEQQSDELAMNQLESIDGDSEVNAVNSEEEEGGPGCTCRTANQSLRKRKKTVAQKRAGKKAKKGKVSNAVEAQGSNGEDSTKTMIDHFNVVNNVVRRSPRLSKRL